MSVTLAGVGVFGKLIHAMIATFSFMISTFSFKAKQILAPIHQSSCKKISAFHPNYLTNNALPYHAMRSPELLAMWMRFW